MSIREWFEGLAPRERLLVTIAAALTVVAIVVVAGLRPLIVSRKAASEQLADRRSVLADIERVAARIGPQTGGSATAGQPSGESLVVLVDRTTRSHGLGPYLKRNEPDGSSSIRLRFENAPFDELVTWLGEMQSIQQVGVETASADPGQDAGRVNANLQLSRTAAAQPAP